MIYFIKKHIKRNSGNNIILLISIHARMIMKKEKIKNIKSNVLFFLKSHKNKQDRKGWQI